MNRHRLVRVPASSANLGPGYDVLAAALSLDLELEVEETGEFSCETDVPGVPTDRSNLCVRAFEALHPADGLTFQIRSEIPASAGLGSSAAAIVAGLVRRRPPVRAGRADLRARARARGASGQRRGGPARRLRDLHRATAGRFDPPPGLEGVIAIPPDPVPTDQARAALPDEVPDGGRRPQRGARRRCWCSASSERPRPDRRAGFGPAAPAARANLYPRSMELVGARQELGAVGATISGAGPTVLFWIHWQQTGTVMDAGCKRRRRTATCAACSSPPAART